MADLLEKDKATEEEAAEAELKEETASEETASEENKAEGEEAPVDKKQKLFGEFFDCFETFCHALVLMMILFVFVFRFVTVNGTSMTNTLQHEDKLIISDMFYTPETGDIVVLNTEGTGRFSDKYIIKRVIAVGGQTVEIDFENWIVTVDGKRLEESYVKLEGGRFMESADWINTDKSVERTVNKDNRVLYAKFTVPEGTFFAMGDNRNGSSDSRMAGCFEKQRILGRVLIRIGPFSEFGRVE